MNLKRATLVVAGAAVGGLMLAGCSSSSQPAASASPSTAASAASQACAKGEAGKPVEIQPDATCAEVPAGQFGLLYSLARDDIKDARIEVVSGDKSVAVPLQAPDSDGGFLMGFVAESEGTADIAIYVTPSDGSAEQKVQELSVTAVKGATPLPVTEGAATPSSGASPSVTSDGWTNVPTIIPSTGG